jgi:hypothetical protein
MPRSRDELVPIFNFGCRLWLRGITASDHGVWNVGSRVNYFEEPFRADLVVWIRADSGGVEFGVKWDRFIHWLVDRFLAYLFPDLCGTFPRDPPECAKIPPRVHQKWPPKTPLFSRFFPNFPRFFSNFRGLWQPYLGFLIISPIKRHEFVLNGGPIEEFR